MWLTGPVALRHVGSSQTRAGTRVPCIGRQILNHCATREAPEKIFEEIIVENFPNMGKEIATQVQEAQRVPGRINPRRNTPRHIGIKLTKIKDKEKLLQATREK